VRTDMANLEFNTAIARLFELNNHLTQVLARDGAAPAEVANATVLMLAPLSPHVAEALWERLGHPTSLAYEPFPAPDAALLVDDVVEVPVQVNGRVRGRITIAVGADAGEHEAAARALEPVASLLGRSTVRKVVVVPGRMVNFVVG